MAAVIGWVSPKGGTGKSTLLVNVAVVLAKLQQRSGVIGRYVVVVDADMRNATATNYLFALLPTNIKTLYDTMNSGVVNVLYRPTKYRVFASLPLAAVPARHGGQNPDLLRDMTSDEAAVFFGRLFAALKRVSSIVLVDVPAITEPGVSRGFYGGLLRQLDGMVFVIEPAVTTMVGAQTIYEDALRKAKALAVVMNKYDPKVPNERISGVPFIQLAQAVFRCGTRNPGVPFFVVQKDPAWEMCFKQALIPVLHKQTATGPASLSCVRIAKYLFERFIGGEGVWSSQARARLERSVLTNS